MRTEPSLLYLNLQDFIVVKKLGFGNLEKYFWINETNKDFIISNHLKVESRAVGIYLLVTISNSAYCIFITKNILPILFKK